MPRKKDKKYPSSYTLYIPENLDIDAMLATNPPDFKYDRDNFVYFASLPCSIMESYRNRDNEYELTLNTGYVPFYSRIMKQKVDNYPLYLNYLMNNGVLESDGKFSHNSGKCLWYRFTLEYPTTPKPITIKRRSLIKQLINRTHPNIEEEKEVLPATPLSEVPYLTKWFNPALRIDKEKAILFLQNLYQSDSATKGVGYAQRRHNSLMVSVLKIYNNDCSHNLNIDRKGRRFHSPLTNLKSELRAYVTYENKKMVSLDLKSSQPFFSLVLLDINPFDRCRVGDILSLYSDYLYLEDNDINSYIEKLRSLIKKGMQSVSTYKFKGNIIDGDFYEDTGIKIGTYFNQPFEEEITAEGLKKQRDITKKRIMIMQYGKQIHQKFKSLFPDVYELFSLIKAKNHKVLAWVLQYIEAEILLYTVCPQIAKENPDIPLFTIHDAIITTEEHAEYVKNRMIEIIQETVGFTPVIKPELWEEENTALSTT